MKCKKCKINKFIERISLGYQLTSRQVVCAEREKLAVQPQHFIHNSTWPELWKSQEKQKKIRVSFCNRLIYSYSALFFCWLQMPINLHIGYFSSRWSPPTRITTNKVEEFSSGRVLRPFCMEKRDNSTVQLDLNDCQNVRRNKCCHKKPTDPEEQANEPETHIMTLLWGLREFLTWFSHCLACLSKQS